MQKTILFATPRMEVGGAESYILNKTKYLISKGYKVYILSEGGQWESKADELSCGHINISWINDNPDYLKKEELLNRLIKLSNIIDEKEIDIVEANQLFPAVYFDYLHKIKKNKLIVNVLSEISFIEDEYVNLLKQYNDKELYFNISKACNWEIEKNTNCKLGKCVPISIPFKNDNEIKNSEYENKFILTVARLEKEKMYIKNLAIDFMNLCLDKNIRNLSLIIVGDGSHREEVEKLICSLNKKLGGNNCNIIMKGTIVGRELQQLFHDCYIYVGLGTTLINAAYYKKPAIVATYYPNDISKAYGYLNTYDGEVSLGQIIPRMSSAKYEELIYDLMRDNEYYKEIAEKGYRIYKSEFSEDIVMNKWEEVYEKIYKDNTILSETNVFKINRTLKGRIKKIIYYIKYSTCLILNKY